MATSASGIYSDTLQSIVDAKLVELERKRSAFEQSKAQLLQQAGAHKSDAEKLQTLVDGVKTLFGIRSSDGRLVHGSSKYGELELKLANLERFLAQPRYDPSVSAGMLREWEHDLYQQLDVQSSRFEYASLYGQLVTEWLVADKKIGVKSEAGDDLEMSGFEEIESKQMMEARAKWAADVFVSGDTDLNAIQAYLNQLFGNNGTNKQALKALQALRRKVALLEAELSQPDQFNEYVLKWVIGGLLATDLLTEEKRNVLRDFLANSIILNELADVLNLRLASLGSWSWGERVPLEQKRKIQGHFEIVMHEELLQAIFLQYIGVKWSVFLKNAFTEFIQHDGAWISSQKVIPLEDLKRREYYLGQQSRQGSLQAKRDDFWRIFYFMCQLRTSENEGSELGEGEIEADIAPAGGLQMIQQAPMMAQAPVMAPRQAPASQTLQSYQSSVMGLQQQQSKKRRMMASPEHPNEYDGIKKPKNPTQARQMLLHFLSTEMLINTHLHQNLTAFRGQYERWNPLLPHTTILAVMHHLGVSSPWIRFFKTFLEAPLSFKDETTIHHRKRGVPGSHALSDVLGEAVLFCLDLKVNQATNGGRLWRVHDDFWFWSANHDTTVAAWQEVKQFSDIMGLTLDLDKSGSVRAGLRAGEIGTELPQNGIRWGFLFLNAATARFEIDQKMVDHHVGELQRQLSAKTSSVFSWVEAWNAYANTFFTTNFGKSANCFGQQHIDDVLSTLERAQRKLFEGPDAASSVVEYLKQTLATRFDIHDVPEGYVFFPSALGGLELRNPFVLLLQLRDAVTKNPQSLLQQFQESEQEHYRQIKVRFDRGQSATKNGRHYPQYVPAEPDMFLSFDEYARHREEFDTFPTGLPYVFGQLMQRPDEEGIDASTEITSALGLMDTGGVVGQPGKCGINGNWWDMEPYWKWILGLHGPQILRKFGGLNIVDNGILPLGMVSLFRSQGVSWTG